MSLPWKSELRLELKSHACSGWLHRTAWGARTRHVVRAPGRAAVSLPGVVTQLRAHEEAAGRRWPARVAQLNVADECVYYALLPATPAWSQRDVQARGHFAAMLGLPDLAVQVGLLPGGRHWLAVAIEQPLLAQWRDALHAEGLRLDRVRPALVEDLRHIAPRVPHDNALLAVLRDEGAMLLRIERGAPCALAWERFDTRDVALVARRLRAFALSQSEGPAPTAVLIAAAADAASAALHEQARAERWTWLALDAQAAPETTPGELAA